MLPLESCKLFHVLAPADLATLKSVAREVNFPSGGEIFREGDSGDALYAIRSGAVQISAILPGGERQVFSRLLPGEIFGEMAVIDNQPRSASAVSEAATTVYCIPRAAIQEMLGRSPQLSSSLMCEIVRRLREFNLQYVQTVLNAERLALVGRFANTIVHDLKNPLAIISVAADLACAANSTPDSRKVAQQRIRRQVDRVSTMVSDILDFTRGSSGQTALAVMNYSDFLRPLIEEIAGEMKQKGIAVEFADGLPPLRVAMNPRRLSRVFYNLMLNAADEMPEGGTIKLNVRVAPGEIVTEIEDSGGGIAPEIADHLFEAFATFGKSRGTGLGLSIARQIVEEHSGRIYARNLPGRGALFGFTLPLQAAFSN